MKGKICLRWGIIVVVLLLADRTCNLRAGEAMSLSADYAERIDTSTSLIEKRMDDKIYTFSVKTISCIGTGRIVCQEQTISRVEEVRDMNPEVPVV